MCSMMINIIQSLNNERIDTLELDFLRSGWVVGKPFHQGPTTDPEHISRKILCISSVKTMECPPNSDCEVPKRRLKNPEAVVFHKHGYQEPSLQELKVLEDFL